MRIADVLDADWKRLLEITGEPACPRRLAHSFSPRFAVVVLIRLGYSCHSRGWNLLAKAFSLLNFFAFGIEVPTRLEIGPGLVIPHSQGTVLGAATIGRNVTIFHQVTLGAKVADFRFDAMSRPRVGDGVTIGVGAKILGAILIGERAVIGANAVVISDVPPGCVAVGVPARIIHPTGNAE